VFLALEALSCTAYPLRMFGVWPASWGEIGPSTVRPTYTHVIRQLARWGWSQCKLPVLNAKECAVLEERCRGELRGWGVRLALRNLDKACSRPRLSAPDALQLMEDMAFLARGTRVVSEKTVKERIPGQEGGGSRSVRVRTEKGALPEAITREVMERFLDMDVEAEGDAPLEPLLLTGVADVIDKASATAHR
jgi:hypothetical protein